MVAREIAVIRSTVPKTLKNHRRGFVAMGFLRTKGIAEKARMAVTKSPSAAGYANSGGIPA